MLEAEHTKTYEEWEGAYRPIDRTFETVEKTKRDGDLVQVTLVAVASIIIVFIVAAAVVLSLVMGAR